MLGTKCVMLGRKMGLYMREKIKISVTNLYTHAIFHIRKGLDGKILYAPGQSVLTCITRCLHK